MNNSNLFLGQSYQKNFCQYFLFLFFILSFHFPQGYDPNQNLTPKSIFSNPCPGCPSQIFSYGRGGSWWRKLNSLSQKEEIQRVPYRYCYFIQPFYLILCFRLFFVYGFQKDRIVSNFLFILNWKIRIQNVGIIFGDLERFSYDQYQFFMKVILFLVCCQMFKKPLFLLRNLIKISCRL